MTIDEAIELYKKEATIMTNGDNHQIAEWLEELKRLRLGVNYLNEKAYQQGRTAGIDEFKNSIIEEGKKVRYLRHIWIEQTSEKISKKLKRNNTTDDMNDVYNPYQE